VSHSFVKNHIHLVFSTKDRTANIAKTIQPEMWSYMAGICRNQGMAAIAINGWKTMRTFCFTCRQRLR